MNGIWKLVFVALIATACGRRVMVRNVGGTGVELQLSSKASDVLYSKWLNSFEEEKSDGIKIYRPENFPFKAARNRTGFEFLKEGKFIEYTFGPDDKPIQYEGEWIYGKETQTIEVQFHKLEARPVPQTTTERRGYVFEIVLLENGLMKIRKQKEDLIAK